MANRHLSRSVALQTLFEWDFTGKDSSKLESILKRNLEEFAPGIDNDSFSEELINGVLGKLDQLDSIIEKAAPDWPIDQIAAVDRNVLRIGLFELLFGKREEVPPKVAINEAIELAKTFGGDSSGKFVNGVLGTVYREIGEPGKDETSKSKVKANLENIPQERLAGAVVYRRADDENFFALVHDVFGYWTLSKGHLEEGEDEESGAIREVREELGLDDLQIVAELGHNEYIASDPKRGPVRKMVAYFLATTGQTNLKLKDSEGLDDARWFKFDDIAELKMYDDIRSLVDKANEFLKNSV